MTLVRIYIIVRSSFISTKKIREDKAFDSLDALSQQLELDAIATKSFFSGQRTESAIVILNYNGVGFLKKFLPDVIEKTAKTSRIIVADNCSTDDSMPYLESLGDKIEIIQLEKNFGYAEGYNQALNSINSKFALLINSDIEVTPGWETALLRKLNSSENIIACQPQILSFHEKSRYEHAGAAGGFIDLLGYPLCRGRIFDYTEKINPEYEKESEIFWASGAAIGINLENFKKLGGFDPDYFAHFEEIDFCWRAKKAGYKIYYCPESTVYHVGGGTLPYNSPGKVYLNFKNSLITLYKNTKGINSFLLVMTRLILDFPSALLFLMKGNISLVFSIIRAHWHFFGHFLEYRKSKKHYLTKIEESSIGDSREGIGKLNILLPFSYMLRGKKRFSEL